ncbi:MAG: TonB-dependent receptor [Bacteroidota bacterium]
MKKVTLLVLWYGITFFCYAQVNCNKTISGQILSSETREPIPFATVKILDSSIGAISDDKGNFTLTNVCGKEVDFEVRFLGYKTVVHHHDFRSKKQPDKSHLVLLSQEENMLESVVIESEADPSTLKTLEAKEIEVTNLESLGGNAADVLAKATGVSTLKTGQNVVKPIVHGLHSNRVLVLNNGVRHASQSWGEDHGIEIDISQVDKIQLIKGASTVRYGSEALGGVILFGVPSPKFNNDLSGEVSGGYQTNGKGYSGEINLEKGYKRIAWRVAASGAKSGDLRAPRYQLTNTGKEELGLNGEVKFHFPSIDINVFASRFDQELGVLRSSFVENLRDLENAITADEPSVVNPFTYDINNPRQEVIHSLAKLNASVFIGNQQFDINYAYQKNTRKEFDIRLEGRINKPVINLDLASHSFEVGWSHPSKSNWQGAYGLQLTTQDNNNIPGTDVIPFVPNFNVLNAGLFGIESYSVGNSTYEAGLRFDYQNFDVRGRDRINRLYDDNVTYQNLTFTLGFSTKLNESLSFQTNIGSAWRAPNINELYAFGNHQNVVEFGLWRYEYFPLNDSVSTFNVLTNDDKEVKSERGLKWVATFDYQKNGWRAAATPHFNWIENFFFRRPFGTTETERGAFPFHIYDQTTAIYSGIDVDVTKTLSATLNGEFKASYIYAKDMDNNANFVGIPPVNTSLSVEKRVGDFSFKLTSEYEFRQFLAPEVIQIERFNPESPNPFRRNQSDIFDFIEAPDGFFLLSASIGYEKEQLKVRLSGDNLLNTSYRRFTDNLRYFADDLGVNVGIYASYSF